MHDRVKFNENTLSSGLVLVHHHDILRLLHVNIYSNLQFWGMRRRRVVIADV